MIEMSRFYIPFLTIDSTPGLKRGLSPILWWLRSGNYVKFTEEYVIKKQWNITKQNKNKNQTKPNKSLQMTLSPLIGNTLTIS